MSRVRFPGGLLPALVLEARVFYCGKRRLPAAYDIANTVLTCDNSGMDLPDLDDIGDLGPDVARRFWTYGRGHWDGPLVSRGVDEYGNRTLAFRLPGERALIVALNIPLRRHRMPFAVHFDRDADMATVEYSGDGSCDCVKRSREVGKRLVVDYDAGGNVHSVEMFGVNALDDPAVVEALRTVLPDYVVDETLKLVNDLLEPADA